MYIVATTRTAGVENISIISESSTGQHCYRKLIKEKIKEPNLPNGIASRLWHCKLRVGNSVLPVLKF